MGTLSGIEAITICVCIITFAINIGAYLMNRDKNVKSNSVWRGSVDTKLDSILGLNNRIEKLEEDVKCEAEWKGVVNTKLDSILSVVKRIDDIDTEVQTVKNEIYRYKVELENISKKFDDVFKSLEEK